MFHLMSRVLNCCGSAAKRSVILMVFFGLIKMKLSKILAILLTAVWLSACAHTGSPDPAKPETEKPTENTSESRTTPSDAAGSEQQESQETSQTSQSSSQNETGAKQQEVRKEPQTSQPTSQAATDPKSDKTAENSNKTRTTSADAADARLAEARENLRTSRETEKRIASELENLKKSGTASVESIEDYEEYLSRVRAMTAENRKIVEQMEAAYNRHSPGENKSDSAVSNKLDKMVDPNIPEEQTVDEVAALDREFNESLAKFDDRLLEEMDAIRAESSKKLQDLAQEAADAAKRLRDKGVDVDTSGSGSDQEADAQKETSEGGRETETTGGSAGTETASRDGSRKDGKGGSADDRHRTDYEDDDIVARQLREAAENETDPELKEKLWKEYEEYKKSR